MESKGTSGFELVMQDYWHVIFIEFTLSCDSTDSICTKAIAMPAGNLGLIPGTLYIPSRISRRSKPGECSEQSIV